MVEVVQRRATRWILSSYSPYQSVTELQLYLNLRMLEQRRVDAKVIMVYKIIHGLVAIHIPSYFEQPMRSTRHTCQPLHFVRFILHQIIINFPSSPTVVYWNQLPAQKVQLPTLDQFSVTTTSHNSTKTVLTCFYLLVYELLTPIIYSFLFLTLSTVTVRRNRTCT